MKKKFKKTTSNLLIAHILHYISLKKVSPNGIGKPYNIKGTNKVSMNTVQVQRVVFFFDV